MKNTTIAAIATPPGQGGIGIIRISGPDALKIAAGIFKQSPERPFMDAAFLEKRSRRVCYGYIVDPDSGQILDEVLLLPMKAPSTYTREDVAEIHVHSGLAVLRAVLDLVLRRGAEPAEPGEFTRRAFLNGRIDLTQAEGIIDMISAQTDASLKAAAVQIHGEMKSRIDAIRERLMQLMAETEAAIDFPDDVGEGIQPDDAIPLIERQVIEPIQTLIRQYEETRLLREGIKITVAGRPNVGKSSLLNRLIQKERAIVTPIPGTTRDAIEEQLMLDGTPVILTDTAGLRQTDDPVEKIGVEKARASMEVADLILLMTDGSVAPERCDHDIFGQIGPDKAVIWVINKSDLMGDESAVEVPEAWAGLPRVVISALHNKGIDRLKAVIIKEMGIALPGSEMLLMPNIRHKKTLTAALNAANDALTGLQEQMPFEFVNMDIRSVYDALGQVIGDTFSGDVLDQVFSRFCIGK